MRFKTGWRNTDLTVTVLRARKLRDSFGESVGVSPAVRAEFKNHFFDSDTEAMWQKYREYADWATDRGQEMTAEDVKNKVEQSLLNHPDYRKAGGWGIHRDDTPAFDPTPSEPQEVGLTCAMVLGRDGDNNAQTCPNPIADGETLYCAEHAPAPVGAS